MKGSFSSRVQKSFIRTITSRHSCHKRNPLYVLEGTGCSAMR
jgi:hypothetical protein